MNYLNYSKNNFVLIFVRLSPYWDRFLHKCSLILRIGEKMLYRTGGGRNEIIEHTDSLSHCLTFIIGISFQITAHPTFTRNPVLVSGASCPVQGIVSIRAMNLESAYCFFYYRWDFVPYYCLCFCLSTDKKDV